ncbi:rubrerythrin-like domain-containing protein [Halomicroarcula limicola]|uniref:Rubrerythrin-like domain-containing protein n=1 Tax=Haloarcula limicola TaxID=1429915 RepID=A0A8J8C4G0_9EURY|nr:rubrerythrin-like domain-containing protein [Halomicroarcula limicola]MBV0925526.1 rubrerythrin-like domain-containing protein [Halomicroarcula limicola]
MPRWSDPAPRSEEQLFECLGCGTRVSRARSPPRCEDCGGEMRNLSVPRPE